MRISNEVMNGALEIFDKHFPNEKNLLYYTKNNKQQ